jgi:hypothetical protein
MVAAAFQICNTPVSSLSIYLEFIQNQRSISDADKKYADFVFRGQPTDEPLVPKLARLKWHGGRSLEMESLILAEFARTIPPFIQPGYDDEWDRLALAQHHGLPTRLLDWTYAATTALWFVVRNGPEKCDCGTRRDGVVWLLKTSKEDFIDFRKDKPRPPIDPEDLTRIFRPRLISNRIAAQSGIFTIHAAKRPDPEPFIALETNSNFTENLIKIVIPAASFESLQKELNVCGTNYATMFPDLDGNCRHLQWRYTAGFRTHPSCAHITDPLAP